MADNLPSYLRSLPPEDQASIVNAQSSPEEESSIKKFLGSENFKDILANISKLYQDQAAYTPVKAALEDDSSRLKQLYGAYSDLANIRPEDLQVNLPDYQSLQGPAAELQQMENLAPSEATGVQMTPETRSAILGNLEQYKKLSTEGMTPEMAAAMGKINRGTMSDIASQNAAIMQQAQASGTAGGGLAAALKAKAASDAINLQQQQEDQLASMAYRGQLEALSQGAKQTQDLASLDLNTMLSRANAVDAANYRGATLRADIGGKNTDRQNLATVQNWQNAQKQANLSTEAKQNQEIINRFKAPEVAANIQRGGLGGQSALSPSLSENSATKGAKAGDIGQQIGQAGLNIAKDVVGDKLKDWGTDLLSGLF